MSKGTFTNVSALLTSQVVRVGCVKSEEPISFPFTQMIQYSEASLVTSLVTHACTVLRHGKVATAAGRANFSQLPQILAVGHFILKIEIERIVTSRKT
jgi:hypothetical protein